MRIANKLKEEEEKEEEEENVIFMRNEVGTWFEPEPIFKNGLSDMQQRYNAVDLCVVIFIVRLCK